MAAMNGLVSIIIPVYNAEATLNDTILSITGQSHSNLEALFVNDGSDDDSVKVIESYAKTDSRIKLLKSEKKGAAGARNTGIKAAAGRYIAFIDADDLWKRDKLSKQLVFIEKTDAAFSFTGYEFADENGQGTGKIVVVPPKIKYKEALKNTTIFTSTVIFDMTKLSKEDIYMPEIKSEDTALWWRLLRTGMKAHGLNEPLTLYRRNRKKRTLSSNKIEAVRRIWNLYRKSEGLSIPYSFYCFCFWAVRAVKRRV